MSLEFVFFIQLPKLKLTKLKDRNHVLSPFRAWHLAQPTDGRAHRGHAQQAELHVDVAEGLRASAAVCWAVGFGQRNKPFKGELDFSLEQKKTNQK